MEFHGLLLAVFALANLALCIVSLVTDEWLKHGSGGILQACTERQTNCTVKVLLAGGAALLGVGAACSVMHMFSYAISRTCKAAGTSYAIAAVCQIAGMAAFTANTHVRLMKPGYSFIMGWVSVGVSLLLVAGSAFAARKIDKRCKTIGGGFENPNYSVPT